MANEVKGRWESSWTGPALMVAAVATGAILLEAAVASGGAGWTARAYLLVGIALLAAYAVWVHVPALRRRARFAESTARSSEHLEKLVRALEELRAGDLVRAAEPARGLPRETTIALEGATRALTGLIQQIQTSSVEVAASAMSVHETASELASGSSQQAAAVVEITATMEELARTAGQIATNATTQAELAARSEQAGRDGATSVEAAVEGVESVRGKMEAIGSRADTLGSRSREIYKVLELISDIARETHILALNAAIEAAAAGEHGDRFSVVAEEVRRLAARSRESVESVRVLLDDFAEAIRAVIVATEEGSKAASQVLHQSHSAQDSIGQLSAAIADTARAAREISLATQEQRTASDQVVLTLKEVSEVIQRMAEGLRQFTGTADRLNHVALSIQLLTQSFRLDSSHSLKHRIQKWATDMAEVGGNLEAIEGVMHEAAASSSFLELAYLVDPGGTMMAFVANAELIPRDRAAANVTVGQVYADRPWFQAVVRDRRTAVTPLYRSLLTGDDCFTIATAVASLEGDMIGVLGVDVNVRNWTHI